MSLLLGPLGGFLLIIHLGALALTIAALIDTLIRPSGAFVAAGKQTKVLWILLLAFGLLVFLVGIIASIVYFVDVRPALVESGGGGGRSGGGSSSDGPYGPYRG